MKPSFPSFRDMVVRLIACLAILSAPVYAQTGTQTIVLTPGWNAVWLEVEPWESDRPKSPQQVFNDPAIQTVVTPKPLAGLAEFFAADPGTVTTFNQAEWQQWSANDIAGTNNLSLIYGNRPYLVKSTAAVTLNLTGKVRFFRPEWIPDRYNLVGFGLQGSPTFDAFFGPSGTRHPVSKIFTLDAATGNWQPVTGSTNMASGRAYWVYCSGPSDYMGPVSVNFDRAITGALDFGDPSDAVKVGTGSDTLELDLKELVFTNLGTSPAVPALSLIQPDPAAGSLVLHIAKPNTNSLGYSRGNQIGSANLDKTIAAKQTSILSLGARREWTDNTPRTNLYRLNTSANGASFWLPATAIRSGIQQPAAGMPGTPASEMTGLWVGEIIANRATSIVEDGAPSQPTAGSAPMRILLHSDSSGTLRLLSQVTIMQTKTADPEIPSQPVLVVDPAKIPFFEGIKERNGNRVGLRLEAVTYDMPRKFDADIQGALIEDPKFLKLTTLPAELMAALGEPPLTRTQTQKDLISANTSAINAAKDTIPSLLPDYLRSSSSRPPKLVEAYTFSALMSNSLGAGQTVAGTIKLDPFHRSNPFRHAYHQEHTKGPEITRTFTLVFDADQAIADRLRGSSIEKISGLIKSDLTITGTVELRRVSTVDSLQ